MKEERQVFFYSFTSTSLIPLSLPWSYIKCFFYQTWIFTRTCIQKSMCYAFYNNFFNVIVKSLHVRQVHEHCNLTQNFHENFRIYNEEKINFFSSLKYIAIMFQDGLKMVSKCNKRFNIVTHLWHIFRFRINSNTCKC